MSVSSKLPHLRPNIFSYVSGLASQHKAINLAQGFPDFGCSPVLIELLNKYSSKGLNQYAPGNGIPALQKQISAYLKHRDGHLYDATEEITVSAGATEALFCSFAALIQAGDEVIILEPAYDTYEPTIELFGGVVRRVQLLAPNFKVDWDAVKQCLNAKTKAIVLNSPHNPSGTILSTEDLKQLGELLDGTKVTVISDEVYADMVFAPHQHISVSSIPSLRTRSIVIGSFGKSFHITGWKVGFFAAPAHLSAELRKIHSLTTFSVHTPSQFALAELMEDSRHIAEVATLYEKKKNYFLDGLQGSAWQFLASQGSYFLTADYSHISTENDMDFCHALIYEHGIATIPYSAFYLNAPTDQRLVRFCFAKKETTLDQAIEILRRIPAL